MSKKLTPHTLYELDEAVYEFQQERDRACAILGAAQLDYLLALCLKGSLPNGEKVAEELIFTANAPLGQFSARILAAFGMSIIDADTRDEIDQIRQIRNRFAHRLDLHNFEASDEVVSRCNNLRRGRRIAEKAEEPYRSDLLKPRWLFITTVVDLIDDLQVMAGIREEKVERVLMTRSGGAVARADAADPVATTK